MMEFPYNSGLFDNSGVRKLLNSSRGIPLVLLFVSVAESPFTLTLLTCKIKFALILLYATYK